MKSKIKNTLRLKADNIYQLLHIEYPEAKIALNYTTCLELLIATMLSAQCTDERVNKVTEKLFQKYRSVHDFALAPIEELEQDVFSTGFYKAKARNIKACCQLLLDQFSGEVPNTIDELTSLPGVGRKTANVVLGHWFNIPGMVVDTHVTRITNLLGLTKGKDAVQLEFSLMEIIPKERWVEFTHLMIQHGRAVCIARRPQCSNCSISAECDYFLSKNK